MNEEKKHACRKDKESGEAGSCFPEIPSESIRELARILEETSLSEIEIEHKERRIKVSRAVQGAYLSSSMPSVPSSVSSSLPSTEVSKSNYHEIKSPMVGTYYSAPSPGADPFVKVGDKIKKGQTVCIVEAMKIMNELPSDVDGEIIEICVDDSEALSFGQVLIKVKEA